MHARKYLAMLLTCVLPSFAVNRLGAPVAPSLWDAFLPESVHPSYASDLGALQEGRLGLGMLDADLSHMSLSVPGLQIISANTRWNNKGAKDRLSYDADHAHLALDDRGEPALRYRELFQVSGGLRLSNFLTSLRLWDLGGGLSYTNISVSDEDERMIWRQFLLGGSVTLQYRRFSLSGNWDSEEQRYRLGYRQANDLQAGLEVYQNLQSDRSYGTQFGLEKNFREGLKFRGGLRWQWAQGERIEQFILLGTSIRFRPWREGIDPDWTRPFVSPMNNMPLVQQFLFDWEIALDMLLDRQYNEANIQFTLTRWF